VLAIELRRLGSRTLTSNQKARKIFWNIKMHSTVCIFIFGWERHELCGMSSVKDWLSDWLRYRFLLPTVPPVRHQIMHFSFLTVGYNVIADLSLWLCWINFTSYLVRTEFKICFNDNVFTFRLSQPFCPNVRAFCQIEYLLSV
jgi:hypothetical protein